LHQLGISELLNEDIGGFAADIPLGKLRELENVDLTKIKDKPWDRGQVMDYISHLKSVKCPKK